MLFRTTTTDRVHVDGRRVTLTPRMLIGSGGEAEVFTLGGGMALKRFKTPDHPDFAAAEPLRRAVAERLDEQQSKLPALMKLALPDGVAAPRALALNDDGRIAGYTMPLVEQAEVVMRYADRPYREAAGITAAEAVSIFAQLHVTVDALHRGGIVIGDFNDLNVLVNASGVHVIDIDSAQFGPFRSTLFTTRFLDPRLTDGKTILPVRPHDEDSDWYAFASMLFRSLLFIDPYGGIYKPAHAADAFPHDLRPLHRISVFHPDVKLPKQAGRFDALPDELLHRFERTFAQGERGNFPIHLLATSEWRRCACGVEHARPQCPACATAAPRIARPMLVVKGRVRVDTLLTTTGVILATAVEGDRVFWLEHRGGSYRREDGRVVFEGPLDPRISVALNGTSTIVRSDDRVRLIAEDGAVESLRADAITSNERHRYWIAGDTLYRDGQLGPEVIGTILGGLTRFWFGSTFGFGMYQASEMTVAFLFDGEHRGIRDDVKLPRISGQLIDAAAVFSQTYCWLFLSMQNQGRLLHRCVVLHRDGTVVATREIEPDGSDWLSHIDGHAAASNFLLAATDEGLVRIEPDAGTLRIAATFPDTEGIVDASTRLYVAKSGVIAVTGKSIVRLTIG